EGSQTRQLGALVEKHNDVPCRGRDRRSASEPDDESYPNDPHGGASDISQKRESLAGTRLPSSAHIVDEKTVMRCPLWVKSRHMQCKKASPQKRTYAVQKEMSAKGQ